MKTSHSGASWETSRHHTAEDEFEEKRWQVWWFVKILRIRWSATKHPLCQRQQIQKYPTGSLLLFWKIITVTLDISLKSFKEIYQILTGTIRIMSAKAFPWLLMLTWWLSSNILLAALFRMSFQQVHMLTLTNAQIPCVPEECVLMCCKCWHSVRKLPWPSSLTAS